MHKRWFILALLMAGCSAAQVEEQPIAQIPPTAAIQLVQDVPAASPIAPTQEIPTASPIPPTAVPPVTPTLTQLQQEAAQLPVLGVAPELHEAIWLNTSEPHKMANLRGKVVLIDMWTFG